MKVMNKVIVVTGAGGGYWECPCDEPFIQRSNGRSR